jgi:hypothetical protein
MGIRLIIRLTQSNRLSFFSAMEILGYFSYLKVPFFALSIFKRLLCEARFNQIFKRLFYEMRFRQISNKFYL